MSGLKAHFISYVSLVFKTASIWQDWLGCLGLWFFFVFVLLFSLFDCCFLYLIFFEALGTQDLMHAEKILYH